MTSKEALGIRGIDAIQLFVRDLARSRAHYVEQLDFAEVAVGTPAHEREHGAESSVVEAGNVRFILSTPTTPESEAAEWLAKHPEGAGRIIFDVSDAERAFDLVRRRGGTPTGPVERRKLDDGGMLIWFDIATPIGNTRFRFLQREDTALVMPDLRPRALPPRGQTNRFDVRAIDHVTCNFLSLEPMVLWMEHVLGLERFWSIEFHTQSLSDARDHGSGLRSVVCWDPSSGVKFANNEPAAPRFKSSQIYTFCEAHRGAGVQHVALSVGCLVTAVRGMRARGVEFMPTPPSYFDRLHGRLSELGIDGIAEDVADLRALEILLDGAGPGSYLLQIFMREAASLFGDPEAGPLFLELIQRCGDQGFGGGNFRALFESIELDQQLGEAS